MIQFSSHYFREAEDPKLWISLDWYTFNDRWHQRFMLGSPMWDAERMEQAKELNAKRCRRFRISLGICGLSLSITMKLKKIGNLLHGRIMDDEADAAEWRERIAQGKARREKHD